MRVLTMKKMISHKNGKQVLHMRILAISPHADDVEVGMGGTIARYVAEGHDVKIVVAIVPREARTGVVTRGAKEQRLKECLEAARILGGELEVLDIDPYAFGHKRKYVKLFDELIRRYEPKKIFIPWEHDSHQDHNTMARIVYGATRKNDISLYMYESTMPGGITSHAFRPQMFINISEHIETKLRAVATYESMIEHYEGWLDAIRGGSRSRGWQIGVEYAEAFEVVKEIIY